MAIDQGKLKETAWRIVGDLAAAAHGAIALLGDRLGLYRALAAQGAVTAGGFAAATGFSERYLREWLNANVAGRYVEYDAAADSYFMTPEQAACLADPDSPLLMAGGFYGVASLYVDEPRIAEAFRTGEGVPWGEHSPCLFCGTERFFGPGYRANIVEQWLPALHDVIPKLERGALVADVGCGHALSTRLMARAFPKSTFVGFDYHQRSIDHARDVASTEGLSNIRFERATAQDFPGENYDLVTFFDCLHDMGDPQGAARHVKHRLAADGTWMIVEPRAADRVSDNINPISRSYYAFSTMVCVPAALSQTGGAALGGQAGEAALRAVVVDGGGFSRFRRAIDGSVNMVLEARP